ncbi:MAG: pyridoxal-phosphate dependent enzyme [Calditrichaeota bacterium]|nr:MAG: pyridoxal-phosphate dependent enzyme [Calditrichota bacterium]
MFPVSMEDIHHAAERIRPYANHTPVFTSQTLNKLAGASVFLKCENFQKVGAFKFRGACNTVFSLSPKEASKGVATHSSGNHAAALSLAASIREIPAHIVMPENAPKVKKQAVQNYGGQITFCENTLTAREETLSNLVEQCGATVVHPYNDYRIIAGQGTAAAELLQDVPMPDYILAPVGGGGLLSGTALSAHYLSPKTKVVGVEPAGAADAHKSFKTGTLHPSVSPKTIADGLLTSLGDKTFTCIREFVSDIVTVDEEEILGAMHFVWERMKIIIEPSSAVPVAAVLYHKIPCNDKRVGIIVSGGNVDLKSLPWL